MTTEEKGNIRIDVPSGSLAAEGSPPGTEIDGSQGIFELRDANDLLAKLERDFVAFEAQPWNSDLAFNFFVTGWSMLEWYYPNDKPKRNAIRNGSVPLQVCHYIASGAKHFDPRDPIHESVTATGRRNAPEELTGGKWASGAWADGAWESSLTISLSPTAEAHFGESKVPAVRVAAEVLEFWRGHTR